MRRRALVAAAAAAAGVAAFAASPQPAPGVLPAREMPPPDPREFRAAWVATVANIDWPSAPGLPADRQRNEATTLLDRAVAIGLNALILQVRPALDAIYPSAIEPWSEYLTGAQGRAPVPAWDPLAFWVAEAHRRGIELHAWFNPYRARHATAKSPLAPGSFAVRRADLVRQYGDLQWMDPGEPDAAAHTLAVVADVVRRYDIDAVHIDDYFYPYPHVVGGVEQPFPDTDAWARYTLGGGLLERDDWRRANVDALVQEMHATVQRIKPWVRFGVSPFGIGRPDRRPGGISGFSQVDKLYADVERWFENGWLDYLAPQLYWPIDRPGQQFPVLLDYWTGINAARRHVWPGLFTSLVTRGEATGPRAWPAREIVEQIALLRSRPGAGGHIHFSIAALMQDRDGIATLLRKGPYATPALVPSTPWLADALPAAPVLRAVGGRVLIDAGGADGAPETGAVATATARVPTPVMAAPARWAVWRRSGGRWRFAVLPGVQRWFAADGADAVVVSAIDRVGQASERVALRLR